MLRRSTLERTILMRASGSCVTQATQCRPGRPLSSNRRPKVLVIDDEDGMHYLFRAVLGDMLGMRVVTAFDSEDALELARHCDFDLITTDFNRPGVSALEFLSLFREENRT